MAEVVSAETTKARTARFQAAIGLLGTNPLGASLVKTLQAQIATMASKDGADAPA